jgi:hypothetical protein
MRSAALPTFKKLNHVIRDLPLKKGDRLLIEIDNQFDVSAFKGEKRVLLTTTAWIGGKNDFLGYLYIVVGILCFVLAIGFFVKHRVSVRIDCSFARVELCHLLARLHFVLLFRVCTTLTCNDTQLQHNTAAAQARRYAVLVLGCECHGCAAQTDHIEPLVSSS